MSLGRRSEEHTSELQSPCNLVCRLLLEKKKKNARKTAHSNRTRQKYHRKRTPERDPIQTSAATSQAHRTSTLPPARWLSMTSTSSRPPCATRRVCATSPLSRRPCLSKHACLSSIICCVSERCAPTPLAPASFFLSLTSLPPPLAFFFFFNDPAPPEISPFPLPAALPIPRPCPGLRRRPRERSGSRLPTSRCTPLPSLCPRQVPPRPQSASTCSKIS